jgi:hypothetical protein
MEIDEIIAELKQLDLSTKPEKRIRELLKLVGPIAYVIITFHKDKVMMRARPNGSNRRFKAKVDFSYKPAEKNLTYQRASTPEQTMFYATVIPDKIEQGELDNMRIIGITETLPIMRDKTASGYLKISFGKWVAEDDITLLAIVHKDKYLEESNYTKELVSSYKTFLDQFPPDVVEKSMKFQTFMSEEFSKENITENHDYMISAIFSELAVENGVEGIFYPSVRTSGRGFNVAIKPEATEKLRLVVAGECSLYKLKDHDVVGNDAIVEIPDDKVDFEIIDIENHRSICLNKLGVKSIDDLK